MLLTYRNTVTRTSNIGTGNLHCGEMSVISMVAQDRKLVRFGVIMKEEPRQTIQRVEMCS
jgi:hypothetical protein